MPAFAGMTERGEVPSANSHHSEVNERFSPPAEKPGASCFCCFLQQNISQVSVGRLTLPGFSIGMRLRKQQRTWLFLAVPGCFRESPAGSGSQMHGAGDYQFDSEIASRNSYSSNYFKGRRSGAWPSLCHAPQTAAWGRVGKWRGGGRPGMSVSAPFVWRCLSGSTIAPFPLPSHRTGHADFPASGSRTRPHAFAHGTSRPSRVRRTSPKVS